MKNTKRYYPKNLDEWIEGILNLIGEGFEFLKANDLFGFVVKFPMVLFFVGDVITNQKVTVKSCYPLFFYGTIALLYFGGYMYLAMKEAWYEEKTRREKGEDEIEKQKLSHL